MNASRRDLLKMFGAGVVILPAAGAGPLARLLEPAKVELIEPDPIIVPINLGDVGEIAIHFKMLDGTTRISRGKIHLSEGLLSGKDTLVEFREGTNASPPMFEYRAGCSYWAKLS